MISAIVYYLFNAICLIILVVALLSWVPVFDFRKEPIATLVKIYNTIIEPFRAVIPPIGRLDFSPVIALMLRQFVGNMLIKILINFGL